MSTDLIKPDLSKDTSGPFVTRDGRKAVYVATPFRGPGAYPYAFQLDAGNLYWVTPDGQIGAQAVCDLDIFIAPKEPKTVFVNWYRNGVNYKYQTRADADLCAGGCRLALLQLEVDDHGVPVDGSTVRRVET